jgi:cyclophilin family peptidyl-prolyl cis-trans isomerase
MPMKILTADSSTYAAHRNTPKNGSHDTRQVCSIRRLKPNVISFVLLLFTLYCTQLSAQEPPFALPPRQELSRIRSAIIETDKGKMRFELFPEEAPWHVANFKYLADKGFYRNKIFHLTIPGYIVQGGAPSAAAPNGGPGYLLPPEFSARKHTEGTLGMARLPDSSNRERSSNGSQFHILLRDNRNMDGIYTIFGQITNGRAVLRDLEKGDLIKNVTVYVTK